MICALFRLLIQKRSQKKRIRMAEKRMICVGKTHVRDNGSEKITDFCRQWWTMANERGGSLFRCRKKGRERCEKFLSAMRNAHPFPMALNSFSYGEIVYGIERLLTDPDSRTQGNLCTVKFPEMQVPVMGKVRNLESRSVWGPRPTTLTRTLRHLSKMVSPFSNREGR